ncbi:MAG: Uma2 family endonuclease [Geminicoccaceae bacterium]
MECPWRRCDHGRAVPATGTNTRHQLIDGDIVVMNPPHRAPHARLAAELGAAIRARLPSGCGVHAGVGVMLSGKHHDFRIPDLAVSCVASREHWIEQPRLVIEILSRSTQKNDVTGKLAFYRSIASIDEILLVRFDQRWCDLWQCIDANWSIEDHIGSALLPMRITTEPLPLDEIYDPLDL